MNVYPTVQIDLGVRKHIDETFREGQAPGLWISAEKLFYVYLCFRK